MITIITPNDKNNVATIFSLITCKKKMQQQNFHKTHSSIYPGEYTHLFEGVHFKKTRRKPFETLAAGTFEKIEDLGKCYFIEMSLPGITKEEFVVETCGNILSVVVIPSNSGKNIAGKFSQPKFDFGEYFIKEVLLPIDADPLFVSAKYHAGTLEIFIPKSKHPLRRMKTKIAVY